MSNILIVDKLGECLNLCMRLQQEKHEIKWNIQSKWNKDIGDGIIPKISAWQKYISWADLILFMNAGFGNLPKKLRIKGKNVIGGTSITDRMENDLEFSMRMMRICDIQVPKYYIFNNFKDGKQFIQENPKKRFIFKPLSQTPKEWIKLLQPETQDVILEYLEDNMKGGKFMLQESIEGIEMSIGGWFNGKKFLRPVLPNFEFKRLICGDVGPDVGKMGSVMIYKDRNRLFTETLEKTSHVLEAEGFVGFVELNCIITEKGAYALKWKTSFEYPITLIQDEIHKEDWGSFFMGLANTSTNTFKSRKNNWSVGVAVVTLPWPVEMRNDRYKNIPIFVKKDDGHIHYSEAKLKNNKLVTAGSSGYIAVVTGHDKDLKTAIDYANVRAEKVKVDNGYFRTDIGYKLLDQLPLIKRWGYLSK